MSYTPPIGDASNTRKGVVMLGGDLAGTASAPTVPGLAGKADKTTTVTGANSVMGGGDLSASRTLSLVGDAAAPGNSKYYGTNATGTKGYYDLPAGGTGGDPVVGGDLSGTASNAQIVANAVGSPEIANDAVTEPKLAIGNTPAAGQMLSWDGAAMSWATPVGGTVYDDGSRFLDSFPGATDDDKLTNAITWQKAQGRCPAIKLGARVHNFNQTRQLYSGLKLIGSPAGPQNLEQSGGVFVPTRINLGSALGSGAASWWVTPGGNLFDIYMANFAVAGDGSSSKHQFIDVTTGSLYACQFHALGFNFMKGVFGTNGRKCLITQTVFSGHWTANNLWDTQFMLGGADNNLWMDGYLNVGPSSSPAQTGSLAKNSFELVFDNLSKTNVGFIFMSALNGWRGLKVSGAAGHGLRFFGGAYEGYKNSNDALAAPGTVIKLEGGAGAFYSPSVGQGMQNPDPTEKGLIHMTGGEWAFYSPHFYRTPAADSVPMIYVEGGRMTVTGATRNDGQESWTRRPRYMIGGPVVTGPNGGEDVFYCTDMSMTP